MKFNVTEVEFDFDEFGDGNPEWQLTFDEEIEIRDLALGVWEAEDEDDLIEEITSASNTSSKSDRKHSTVIISYSMMSVMITA